MAKEILEIITEKPDSRKIFWYWERTGAVGKTTLVRHILLNHNAVLLDGNKRDMAYAWTGQPIVIFDFERTREGRVPYGGLEKIKDGLIFLQNMNQSLKYIIALTSSVSPTGHLFQRR